MKKKDIIELLIEHFKKYNSKYFIDNINIDNINYNKYFLCLLKRDLIKIYQKIGEALSTKNLKKENKKSVAKILSDHFNNNTIEYFLNIINNTYFDNINYGNYLKCLPKKNIEKVLVNIHKNSTPDTVISKSSKKASIIMPNPVLDVPKNISVISKSSKKASLIIPDPVLDVPKNKRIKKVYKENIDIELLPFNAKRVQDNDFEEKLERVINTYKRRRSNIIKYITRLSQLFLDDIIIMKDMYAKPMKIKIIKELYINTDTLLYIGEVIEGTMKGSNVVVKIQPKIPEKFKNQNIDIMYQINTEYYIMKLLNINCANAIVSKVYAYGYIDSLIEGDIERYVLVSEYLGKDLTTLKYEENISNIRDIFILILKALKSMHNCNLNKYISIVHRDIKPENIVFTDNTRNEIKIIDFGISTNVFDVKNTRNLKENTGRYGTLYFMSIMQHKTYVIDYLDDLQAISWMLLDILGKKRNILYYSDNNIDIDKKHLDYDKIVCNNKINFLKNYKNPEYIKTIEDERLTENNISVIGEIVEYTMARADKINNYPTDKKTSNGVYYSDYNELYYSDIEKILSKLK
jgi:serine/threonine protein kinase